MKTQIVPDILVLGKDFSALNTQANLLTLAGFSVHSLATVEAALRRVRFKRYDLVIVSETFSPEEQAAIRRKFRLNQPALPVMLLDSDDPVALIENVAERLRTDRGPVSTPGVSLWSPMRSAR